MEQKKRTFNVLFLMRRNKQSDAEASLFCRINQKQLAEMMSCSQQYISKILKGRENLSLETLSKIERALGISIIKEEQVAV